MKLVADQYLPHITCQRATTSSSANMLTDRADIEDAVEKSYIRLHATTNVYITTISICKKNRQMHATGST